MAAEKFDLTDQPVGVRIPFSWYVQRNKRGSFMYPICDRHERLEIPTFFDRCFSSKAMSPRHYPPEVDPLLCAVCRAPVTG